MLRIISHLEIFVHDIDYVNQTAYEINENFSDIIRSIRSEYLSKVSKLSEKKFIQIIL